MDGRHRYVVSRTPQNRPCGIARYRLLRRHPFGSNPSHRTAARTPAPEHRSGRVEGAGDGAFDGAAGGAVGLGFELLLEAAP